MEEVNVLRSRGLKLTSRRMFARHLIYSRKLGKMGKNHANCHFTWVRVFSTLANINPA